MPCRLRKIIDELSENISVSDSKSLTLHGATVAVKIMKIAIQSPSPPSKPYTLSFEPTLIENELNLTESPSPRIALPYEALLAVANLTATTKASPLMASSSSSNLVRVKFVAYKSAKLFNVRPKYHNPHMKPGAVIEAAIMGLAPGALNRLRDPVVYFIPYHNDTNLARVTCVFWDEASRRWSTQGITTELMPHNSTAKCYSDHLTAFSVLLDFTPSLKLSQGHQDTLTIITYIGCGISSLGLLLTVITYGLFKSLNKDYSGQILLNLCLSLLALNLSFIIGSFESTWSQYDCCLMMAILIHYFVLTSLSWMAVEAIHIYHLLIYVFASRETHYMLKRFAAAWGKIGLNPTPFHSRTCNIRSFRFPPNLICLHYSLTF